MFCNKCGTQLPEDAGFCNKCGVKVVRIDTATQSPDTVVPAEKSSLKTLSVPARAILPTTNESDFKAFVDNHVRMTTKFQSADNLLRNSNPLSFIWVCFGVVALVYLIIGMVNNSLNAVGFIILVPLFGYAAAFVAGGVIRSRYRAKF